MTGDLVTVPLEACFVSVWNPRKTIRPEAIEELAAGIREAGRIIEPPIARLHVSGDSSRYEIVAGQCRFLAARHLGMGSIDLIISQMDDVEAATTGLLENLDREDLSPVDEARMYARLRREKGLSVERISELVHRKKELVWDRLALLALPEAALNLVATQALPVKIARAMSNYPPSFREKVTAVLVEAVAASPRGKLTRSQALKVLAPLLPEVRAAVFLDAAPQAGEEVFQGDVCEVFDPLGMVRFDSDWVVADQTPTTGELHADVAADPPTWEEIAIKAGMSFRVVRAVDARFRCFRLLSREEVYANAHRHRLLRRTPVSKERGDVLQLRARGEVLLARARDSIGAFAQSLENDAPRPAQERMAEAAAVMREALRDPIHGAAFDSLTEDLVFVSADLDTALRWWIVLAFLLAAEVQGRPFWELDGARDLARAREVDLKAVIRETDQRFRDRIAALRKAQAAQRQGGWRPGRPEDEGRRTEDGGRRTEDGERRTEDGGRRTEDDDDAR